LGEFEDEGDEEEDEEMEVGSMEVRNISAIFVHPPPHPLLLKEKSQENGGKINMCQNVERNMKGVVKL
jgi:hypothetical protein